MRRSPFLLLIALLGCEHSDVGSVDPGAPEGPFDPSLPTRLTYSGSGVRPALAEPRSGGNREVAWSTDPARIVYAFGAIAPLPQDRVHGCVADLPATGGSQGIIFCDREVARLDSSTTVEWPSVRDDGEFAFVRRRFGPYSASPLYSDFALQSTAPGQVARSVFTFPKHSPVDGRLVQGIAFPRWVDHDHLIALGRVIKRGGIDPIQSGLDVVVIDVTQGEAGVSFVPGTHFASSVTLGATADTIYYTQGGDSRIYRRSLLSGAVDTVFDFGALGIARDVRVGPDLVIAVVGGAVSYVPDSVLGMIQVDLGGPVLLARLSTGTITTLGEPWDYWQHPALAPDLSAIIVEQGADLWRIPLP